MQRDLTTNEEWRLWGKLDPMYGVAVWQDRQRGGSNPWTEDEFYELGRSDWNDFRQRWRRYGLLDNESVAEIGCGVGRITKPLAACFKLVYALDVSEDMISFAQSNISSTNIQWIVSEQPAFPIPADTVSGVFTCHVFQHLESTSVIEKYFQESFRILKPGGSILAHVPIHIFPLMNRRFSRLAKSQYKVFLSLSSIKALIKRFQMRLGSKLYMHGVSIDQEIIFTGLDDIGYEDIEIIAFRMKSNNGFHTCIIATKPQSA